MNLNLTLIGQTITFFVFVWICKSAIWPPIMAAMRQRQETIADGLAASERAEQDLASAKAEVAQQLTQAKGEAAEIIEQARTRAAQMVEEAKSDARVEGDRVKESANAEIAQDANRVKEDLRAQVSTLAIAGAERVLGERIDAAKHSELLDRLAAEL